MIIEPRMRGFICLTAHPAGCEQNVKNQIAYVQSKGSIDGPNAFWLLEHLQDLDWLQELQVPLVLMQQL
jgi:hypothetical protein